MVYCLHRYLQFLRFQITFHLIRQILALIFACRIPAENAIIIAEHSIEEPPDMTRLGEKCSVWKEKKVGNMVVTYLLCRGSEGEGS